MPRLVCVGVPGSKRARGLAAAAGDRLVLLPWSAALGHPEIVGATCRPHDHVRIDSPGEDHTLWEQLAASTVALPTARRPGAAWAVGLARAMAAIEATLPAGVHVTHPAATTLAMTDKLETAARLAAAGVPTPETERAPMTMTGLAERLRELRWGQAFVKPRWGSSGAGVCAVRHHGERWSVTTPARILGGVVVNHKRLWTTERPDEVEALLAPVLADGAVLQRWVPKATTDRGAFDVRVLVIAGRARHRIARVGRGPITNLHLDSARMAADEALAGFGGEGPVLAVAAAAAAVFTAHHTVGVDVMVDTNGRPFVIELNAWGDHLPGLLDGGEDPFLAQVRALLGGAA